MLLAYDVGLSIDLDAAEQRIKAERELLKHRRRAPSYFEYRPHPLRISEEAASVAIGPYATSTRVDLVLYDFGAVSVAYEIPLGGPLEDLVHLSEGLSRTADLLEDSRRRVGHLVETIAPAVMRPSIAEFVETYAIFEIRSLDPNATPDEIRTRHAPVVARILRTEHEPLSEEEIGDAFAHCISYGLDDIAVIDWDGALLVGRDLDDVRAVLEFANVELLEMRFLDQQLDDSLTEAYEALLRRAWQRFRGLRSSRTDLRHIAQLQVDSAILFEGVNNALKLLGDQYLARVYRMVSARFHLEEWDASILRKLEALESLYQKVSDVAATWRLEMLEWIIIVLIAISIVLPFVPGFRTH